MAKTIVANGYGGPEVLLLIDEPTPMPGPGQAVVEVRAVGTNPIDYKSYSGMMGTDPAILPKRVGSEAAGIVRAVGSGVSAFSVGDEVIAYPAPGAYTTELLVSADSLVHKPSTLDFEPAAGLLLTGATAVHLLTAADVSDGDTVVIHGASGGVGLMAVQLAVARGARVIATAGAGSHAVLAEFGATPVIYGDGLIDRIRELTPDGVDVALDLVGTDEAVDTSLELVADRSRIATIAAFGRAAKDGITLLGGGPGADPGTEIRSAARPQLAELAASGQLKVLIAETFPLSEAAAAHRALAASHAPGKIILTV